jgi:quinohemoprotein ethanol dehydrogenase
VIAGVQDGRLFALDAKSGVLWETLTTTGDNRYITGRVFNGKSSARRRRLRSRALRQHL